MSIITSHEITRFFEQHRTTEVTFNKQVIEATGLLPMHTHLKAAGGGEIRCVLFACSMAGARLLVAELSDRFFQAIQLANGHVSVRIAFKRPEKTDPLPFYVSGTVTGFTPYNPQNPAAQLVAVEFPGRPSDDLIQVLGVLIEANANARQRSEERVIITPDSLKNLGLEPKDYAVVIEGEDRKCMLRDVSFSGAKVLVAGVHPSIAGQPVGLRLRRAENDERLELWGEVARTEEVSGHPEILALGIRFIGEPPVAYKMMLSAFLSGGRRISPAPGRPAPGPHRP
jgi:hypothetical protein